MMLSIAKCQNLGYYEREVIDGREDYLSEGGTAPGRWTGTLAAAYDLTGPAEREHLVAAFAGHHPDGRRLCEHPTSVAGFDLTLSPSKSVSLLWALGTPSDAAAVEAALDDGQAAVERYLEQVACRVRRGHGGCSIEPGAGFLGAVFRHRTSRLGDPDLHLHWVVFNVSQGPDGRHTALDARALYQHRYVAEAIFQATLRHSLTRSLGVVFDAIDRHGVGEITGISAAMRRAFSRRRAEILTELDARGASGGKAARVATLATRKAKPRALTEIELRTRWRQQALEARFDLERVVRVPRTPTLRVADEAVAAAVTVEHASYERNTVLREIARAASQGATLEELLDRTDAYLDGPQAVPLTPGLWTTPEILALEAEVLSLATSPARTELATTPAAVAAAVAARPSLTGEQRRMVEQLCLSGRPVDVVIGHAGTGKTFTLDAIREAFHNTLPDPASFDTTPKGASKGHHAGSQAGRQVVGAALAARAARELQAGSGIPATTAHRLLTALQTGRAHLNRGDVVVLDEAGMIGTRLLAAVAGETGRAGAKLILVGDPRQLPEVEAGGLLSALAARAPVVELVENRRQTNPHERQVATDLRHGRAELAVRRLDDTGRVTVASNSDDLREQLVADWLRHRQAGADVVMGALHRADVRDLNRRAHELLEQAGELGAAVATVDDTSYQVVTFNVGDQVLAGRNRYDLGIVNGDLATIEGASADGTALRLSLTGNTRHQAPRAGNGGTDSRAGLVEVPLDYVRDHLTHAYARTVHKTQGLTCDVALLLGDDALYNELGYTGLTRGRSRNHLYTVVATLDHDDSADRVRDSHELEDLIAALGTRRGKTSAHDLTRPPGTREDLAADSSLDLDMDIA